MGGEFGQFIEWNYQESLDWHLLQYDRHQGIQRWLRDLNRFYRSEPALYELDFQSEGFSWIDCGDWEGSIISYLRQGRSSRDLLLAVCNFTPVPRVGYRVGAPAGGLWQEVLNSDAEIYGGSGHGNFGGIEAEDTPVHGRDFSLTLTLPPLGIVVFKKPESR